MKLLLIEDDPAITEALRSGLSRIHFIDASASGKQGLHKAEVNVYDAIILDLSLPDVTGLWVCEQLRQGHITTPILVLTGHDGVNEKVALLDAGADDYLTKPFNLEELKARLRVLTRHHTKSAYSSKLVAGDLTLDTATRRIKRAGKAIRLRRKEFDLLEYLMQHAGLVVTRVAIIDHIWDENDALWTNAVDVHIKHLRDKVDRPFEQQLIKTVHGVGYKLEVTPSDMALLKTEGR